MIASPSQAGKYTCLCCRIKFESVNLQRDHFKTDWHLYNLKRRVCNLEPIELSGFLEIQAVAPRIAIPKEPNSRPQSVISVQSEDDWEEIDAEDLLDEDYDEDEAEEMLAKVVKSNTCLFCEKKSQNMKININHMADHGFFIPEERYLIDADGLLEYLGFKVGAGATCIWCNKQFKTLHGVRLHMMYKDHCKIMYDQDKAIDEYKEFYDYSGQEKIEMKPLNQLVIAKRQRPRKLEDRALMATSSSTSSSKDLVAAKRTLVIANSHKKFNAYRAKIILRTGMANNFTMRGRLRQQNPI